MNDPTKALAAYDAAQVSQPPSDAEIEAWLNEIVRTREGVWTGLSHYREFYRLDPFHVEQALRLMRRARPDAGLLPPGSILPSAPLVPPHDGLLRAAKAVLAVDVLMRNAQNGMPAHVFNGVLEVLQEEAIPDLRAEVARLEGK